MAAFEVYQGERVKERSALEMLPANKYADFDAILDSRKFPKEQTSDQASTLMLTFRLQPSPPPFCQALSDLRGRPSHRGASPQTHRGHMGRTNVLRGDWILHVHLKMVESAAGATVTRGTTRMG